MAGPVRADRGCAGDDVLLARLCAGDDRGLSIAYDRYAPMVRSIARRVTVDEQLAVDVTQEVFVALWRAPDRVDLERGSLRSYLGVMAHRRAVDAVRRAVRQSRAESAAVVDIAPCPPIDDEIVDMAARAWSGARLREVLQQLPDEQREVVRLAYFEGRTLKETAAVLGIPEGTAKSRMRLAMARVRTIAGDDLGAST